MDWAFGLAARSALPLTAVHAPRDLPCSDVAPRDEDEEAEAVLAHAGGAAEALVTDAHHSRRLLDVVTRGGHAYLTVLVPAAPVPVTEAVLALGELDACSWAAQETPPPPAHTRDEGAVPRTLEPVLVPVRRRAAPVARHHRAAWPEVPHRR